jgi:hypothetical protein
MNSLPTSANNGKPNQIKTRTFHIHAKHRPSTYKNINDIRVPTASLVKYLGLKLDTKLTWGIHIKNTVQKARQQFYELRHLLRRESKTPTHLKKTHLHIIY